MCTNLPSEFNLVFPPHTSKKSDFMFAKCKLPVFFAMSFHYDTELLLYTSFTDSTNNVGVLQISLNLRWALLLLGYSVVNASNPDTNKIAVTCGLDVYLSVRDFV